MPFIQRYSDVKKGGIVFTGNTLGLSKASNQNAPGTEGSIGAFTSLNPALQVSSFPAGTTFTAGSVKIDGVAQPAYNPQTGFDLLDLPVGDSVTVEFDVTVN